MPDFVVRSQGFLANELTHPASGQTFASAAAEADGGTGAAASPTDLLLGALASCTLMTLQIVGQRQDLDLGAARAEVSKVMDPKTHQITAIALAVHLPAVPAAQRPRLERAADYCPVHRALDPQLPLELTFHYAD